MTQPQTNVNTPKPQRWWLRFPIWAVFPVTTLVALVIVVVAVTWAERIGSQRAALERDLDHDLGGGRGCFRVDWDGVPWWSASPRRVMLGSDPQPVTFGFDVPFEPGDRKWGGIGDHQLSQVQSTVSGVPCLWITGTRLTDAGVKELAHLTNLEVLDLGGAPITDSGLPYLEGLTNLRALLLHGTKVSDRGLEHLADLRELETLDLGYTALTDSGLAHLDGLKRLKTLDLCNTALTDSGLVHLEGLKELRALGLADTKVTDAGLGRLEKLMKLESLILVGTKMTDQGVSRLQRALPHTEILH